EICQGIAEFVPGGVSPDGIVLGVVLVHFLGGGVAVEDGADNRYGARSDGAVVQVDFVLGDEELLAHLGPVGVFVLVEEGVIGQGWGLFQLGEKASTKGKGGGEGSGGAGKKMASVEHGATLLASKRETGSCYGSEGVRASCTSKSGSPDN